jgi:hypothetical protein
MSLGLFYSNAIQCVQSETILFTNYCANRNVICEIKISSAKKIHVNQIAKMPTNDEMTKIPMSYQS